MDAIREYITGNNILALLIVALVYWIGEVVGNATKAWIPSVFVIAILFVAGYWTIFPTDPNIVTVAGLGPPLGGTLVIMLCIGHMGTVINLKQLAEQWKVILIALAGLVGMIGLVFLVGSVLGLVEHNYVVAALPPLTGGIVAAQTMSTAARDLGLTEAAVLAIAMYIIQGFAGYPLTAIMLKLEGRKLLKGFRANGGVTEKVGAIDEEVGNLVTEKKARKKLLPYVNSKYATTAFFIFKLMVAAMISFFLSQINIGAIWGSTFKISSAVWQLIVAIVLTELGFFEEDILNKAKSYGFLMFVLMIFVFAGLADATPEMLLKLVGPILIILVTGVAGMAVFAGVMGKILKVGVPMAIAVACTALYGFPPNVILTEEGVNAISETPEEKDYLMGKMLPMMIVGGFVTVTITSVIVAGIFTNLFVV